MSDLTRTIEIVTPSYAPDLALFEDLHSSVVRFTAGEVRHRVIVPRRDEALFTAIGSARLVVSTVDDVLPASFVSVAAVTDMVRRLSRVSAIGKIQQLDLTRPWLPVRGWIVQQVVKIAIAAESTASVVLLADSDLTFVSTVAADDFLRDGVVRLYSRATGVHAGMADHLDWHRSARRLLGLDETVTPPLPDHICGLVAWDPRLVRSMVDHIAAVGGRHWIRCVTAERHVSEFILYGTYVAELADTRDRSFLSDDPRCLSHWSTDTLMESDGLAFASAARPSDIAVQIQSTSCTTPETRRYLTESVIARLAR
ncbi:MULTISPECIES: DUF6492 family protein [unclassified Rhodococcus (in: high G+C Gram-positive bacteria)]|uniref:DUF6492 family protein n=1 Tax=unclassified Rhodococcus (in: high G+C Gram-positive bacteria) TaxID=192944 RepID=UPI0012E3AA2A|nr:MULTISPECIES: DUF6492 family protein [unclassified Rhodococcus (in: high G+C Gram-positive bacteria)]